MCLVRCPGDQGSLARGRVSRSQQRLLIFTKDYSRNFYTFLFKWKIKRGRWRKERDWNSFYSASFLISVFQCTVFLCSLFWFVGEVPNRPWIPLFFVSAFSWRFVAFLCPCYQNSVLSINISLYQLATAEIVIEIDLEDLVAMIRHRHRHRYSGYWEAFPYSLATVHHFHISFSHTILLRGFFWAAIIIILLCLFEEGTEWYPMDHQWLVLVLDLKSAEKRIGFFRPAGGRFAVILTEQRNRLHGYHAMYLRDSFSTWKCSGKLREETSDVLSTHTVLWSLFRDTPRVLLAEDLDIRYISHF